MSPVMELIDDVPPGSNMLFLSEVTLRVQFRDQGAAVSVYPPDVFDSQNIPANSLAEMRIIKWGSGRPEIMEVVEKTTEWLRSHNVRLGEERKIVKTDGGFLLLCPIDIILWKYRA